MYTIKVILLFSRYIKHYKECAHTVSQKVTIIIITGLPRTLSNNSAQKILEPLLVLLLIGYGTNKKNVLQISKLPLFLYPNQFLHDHVIHFV